MSFKIKTLVFSIVFGYCSSTLTDPTHHVLPPPHEKFFLVSYSIYSLGPDALTRPDWQIDSTARHLELRLGFRTRSMVHWMHRPVRPGPPDRLPPDMRVMLRAQPGSPRLSGWPKFIIVLTNQAV
jgi:hypothetical protein